MATGIEVEDIIGVFCIKYRDGEISFEELKSVLKMLGFDLEDDCKDSIKENMKSFKPLNIDTNSKKISCTK